MLNLLITQSNFVRVGTKLLIYSHSLFWFSSNLVTPFWSIFFIEQLEGVTMTEVGIASLIFYLSFGILDPVVGFIADRLRGLRDEKALIIFGYIVRGLIFILLSFATNYWHLYAFQFMLGITRALASPADKALFTKFLTPKHRATLWGMDESFINLSAAAGAGLGGYLINLYGFRPIFTITGLLTILSGLLISRLSLKLSSLTR